MNKTQRQFIIELLDRIGDLMMARDAMQIKRCKENSYAYRKLLSDFFEFVNEYLESGNVKLYELSSNISREIRESEGK